MNEFQAIVTQRMIEEKYSQKHVDGKLRALFEESQELMDKVAEGVALLEDYTNKDYYTSKNARVAQLKSLDLTELVFNIFIGIAYFTKPELVTSASAQLATRLRFSDKVASITTVAEILAVLAATDVFDIFKEHRQGSLMIVSNVSLGEELTKFIEGTRYLPPMVCPPLELTSNYSSGYLTHKDGLVLGKGNQHAGDLCLDVLNKMNSVALSLNVDFISKVEEEPTYELDNQLKQEGWNTFKKQSYDTYGLLAGAGNCFYLTHKVDMRGRIYSQGYFVNTEGVGHKKACVDLFHKELITGVPTN